MSAKTKTALKAESDSTFTTNGVRAIKAVDHRTFNYDLIDSLDVVYLQDTNKQTAKYYTVVAYSANSTSSLVDCIMPITLVKDQLLANVISVRAVKFVTSTSNLNVVATPVNHQFYPNSQSGSYGKLMCTSSYYQGISKGNILIEITYIPAE